ncbi:tyrosine-type recombinase/integrase [Gulbenkiania mobilis]|uniref:tyrosine-type recombinase/integrase n=1 Tax=Gulbenkiania mobilis TaxID=397457 RepID=UPI0006BC055C|nr:tyrosine-type recombinase/integrase [Gulbenkiania mobilis]
MVGLLMDTNSLIRPTPASAVIASSSGDAANLLGATSDMEAAQAWLSRHARSANTLRTYEKEVRRYMGWLTMHELALNTVTVADANAYLHWLERPPAMFVGKKRSRADLDEWRPLNKPLSERSLKHAQTILIAFYRYLNDAQYLSGNPFALAERIAVPAGPLERYLDHDLWHRLQGFVRTELPLQPGVSRAHAERCGWLVTFLYQTGARIGELAGARMGDFRQKDGRWWLRITGKGKKTAEIPVSDALLTALGVYRMSLGLRPLPSVDEDVPVVGSVSNYRRPITTQAIHKVIKQVFSRFGESLAAAGEPELGRRAAAMSAHWLRHTSATHQLDAGLSLVQVQRNLRHSKLETTAIYTHVEQDALHEAMRQFGKPKA